VKLYISPQGGIDMVPKLKIACVSVLMSPLVSLDCERFKIMAGRLRARQLQGDDLAGRVLWILSRGPARLGVEYCRELVHGGGREFSLGLPRVVAAWGNQ
jgi:hypothetical protein